MPLVFDVPIVEPVHQLAADLEALIERGQELAYHDPGKELGVAHGPGKVDALAGVEQV